MKLIGMIASWDFCLFLLGIVGVTLFMQLHRLIAKLNPKVFGIACTILSYFVITYMRTP